MLRTRIIPTIQISDRDLVKTVQFKSPRYMGDPVNAIKIFNEKRVDELIILDIYASKNRKKIDFEFIEELCSECFMPVGYGGGVQSLEDIKRLFALGVEKVIVNSLVVTAPDVVKQAIEIYGAQSIVASVDVKKSMFGNTYYPFIKSGKKRIREDVSSFLQKIIKIGVGEIIITDIDREGTFSGYNFDLFNQLTQNITIPCVINGGAKQFEEFIEGKKRSIDAFAAGSFFSLQKPHFAVLITYLSPEEIDKINSTK